MSMSDRLRDEYAIATDCQCVSIAGVCMLKKTTPGMRIRLSHIALQGTSQSNTAFQGNWHESLKLWFCHGWNVSGELESNRICTCTGA